METVNAVDASADLSALVDRVEQGEEIIITRAGKPVARLMPANYNPAVVKAKIDEFRQRRKGSSLGGLTWKDLRDEGRKWVDSGRAPQPVNAQ